jgi:hypothetical protein
MEILLYVSPQSKRGWFSIAVVHRSIWMPPGKCCAAPHHAPTLLEARMYSSSGRPRSLCSAVRFSSITPGWAEDASIHASERAQSYPQQQEGI